MSSTCPHFTIVILLAFLQSFICQPFENVYVTHWKCGINQWLPIIDRVVISTKTKRLSCLGVNFLFHPHHQWGLVPPGRCWSGDTRIFIFYFNTCTYVDNTFERDRGLINLMIQMYYVIYVCTKACTFSRWRSLAPCMPLMAVQPLYSTPVTSRDFLRKMPTWRLSSNRRWILGHSETATPQKNNGGRIVCIVCILQMDIDGYIISKTP